MWEYSSSAAPLGRNLSPPPSPSRSPYHLPLRSLFVFWLSAVFSCSGSMILRYFDFFHLLFCPSVLAQLSLFVYLPLPAPAERGLKTFLVSFTSTHYYVSPYIFLHACERVSSCETDLLLFGEFILMPHSLNLCSTGTPH